MRCQIKLGFILHMTRQKQNRNNSLLIIFLFFVLFSLILFVHHFFSCLLHSHFNIFFFHHWGKKLNRKQTEFVCIIIYHFSRLGERGSGVLQYVRVGRVGIFRYHSNEGGGVLFDTLLVRGGAEFVNTILHWIYSRMFWCCKLSSKLFLRTSVVINALFFVFLQKRWTIKRIHG